MMVIDLDSHSRPRREDYVIDAQYDASAQHRLIEGFVCGTVVDNNDGITRVDDLLDDAAHLAAQLVGRNHNPSVDRIPRVLRTPVHAPHRALYACSRQSTERRREFGPGRGFLAPSSCTKPGLKGANRLQKHDVCPISLSQRSDCRGAPNTVQ